MDVDSLKRHACKSIDDDAEFLHKVSEEIWKNPELAFKEHRAHGLLSGILERRGFQVEPHYVLDTAFRATFEVTNGKTSKPTVAVLCEYDALPGIGHACGHNLIAECGLGAGIAIKSAMETANVDIGKLVVMGTPAEEGFAGKIDLINAGAFDDIDVAIMAHPSQYTISKPPYLSLTQVTIKYQGQASHASSYPWNGVNALDAAVLCYQNLSCLRQQMKPTWRVHGVIKQGGETPNVIPDETELQYYIRAPTEPELVVLKKKVIACIEAAGMATGCSVVFDFTTKPYQCIMHNSTMAAAFEENGKMIGIEFSEDPAILTKFGGSTDMGNVSRIIPALHPKFYIGTQASGHSKDFCTASGQVLAQPYTLNVAKALAFTALDMLTKPRLLAAIKEDFRISLENEKQLIGTPV